MGGEDNQLVLLPTSGKREKDASFFSS